MTAATRKLKLLWIVEGRVERAWRSVEYEAMMMGGSGGRAGCEDSENETCVVGW